MTKRSDPFRAFNHKGEHFSRDAILGAMHRMMRAQKTRIMREREANYNWRRGYVQFDAFGLGIALCSQLGCAGRVDISEVGKRLLARFKKDGVVRTMHHGAWYFDEDGEKRLFEAIAWWLTDEITG